MSDIRRAGVAAHTVGEHEQYAFMLTTTQVQDGKGIFLPLTFADHLSCSELYCKLAHNA
jgi:hypothetical protein